MACTGVLHGVHQRASWRAGARQEARRCLTPAALRVVMSSDQRWFREDGKVEGGAFSFDRVTPGRFRLTLHQNDAVLAHSDWFELQPGEELDVGVLRTVVGGSVRVRAERGPGTSGISPKLYFRHDDAARSTVVTLVGDDQQVDNLTPGHYEVSGYAKGLVAIKGEVTVKEGEVVDLAVALSTGTLTRFAVWVPKDPVVTSYKYTIRSFAGEEVRSYGADFGSSPTRPFPISVTIPPGRHVIEFRADDVYVGRAVFEVTGEAREERVRVDLRRQ